MKKDNILREIASIEKSLFAIKNIVINWQGKPKVDNEKILIEVAKGKKVKDIAKEMKCSKKAIYNVINRHYKVLKIQK